MIDRQHVAVVDDDPDIRETFEEYLDDRGFRVSPIPGGAELRDLIESGDVPELVLLDVTMPGEDGFSLARYLTAETEARVIMVTASGETIDRVVGLELGADDYLAKPVDLRELLARAKAVLRRSAPALVPDAVPAMRANPEDRILFGTCMLDLAAQMLIDEDGQEIRISAMEYDTLRFFAERPNRVLSRDDLLELANKGDADPFDRSIDIRISRLRRKIELDPGKPAVLKTVRGAGYIFVSDRRV